jgi:GTP-binding protein
MFLDEAKINIKAGDGGNGLVSFFFLRGSRKKIANGGSGGRGGNIIFKASRSVNTLAGFRKKVHFKAENGRDGMPNNRNGRNGTDMFILVPVGTVIKDNNTILTDLDEEDKEFLADEGGIGGRGNSSFVSQKRRFPGFAELGEKIEEKWIRLELRLLADAALVGFPNSGKSTIISRISAAKPKIADYPFTTLTPNLGVVEMEDDSFVVADIPGLIKGAHDGTGLGDRFLRHILRVKIIVMILDGSLLLNDVTSNSLLETFKILRNELELYDASLYRKDYIIAINKIDLFKSLEDLEIIAKQLEKRSGKQVFLISAVSGAGIRVVVNRLYEMIEACREEDLFEEGTMKTGAGFRSYTPEKLGLDEEKIELLEKEGEYIVKNKKLERIVAMTDLENEEALSYLKNKLKKMKIGDRLKKMGVVEGSTVIIGKLVFDLVD